jgi:hypothetical protein
MTDEDDAHDSLLGIGETPGAGDEDPASELLKAGMDIMAATQERSGPMNLSVSSGVGHDNSNTLRHRALQASDRYDQASERSAASKGVNGGGDDSHVGDDDDDLPEVTVRGMIIATLVGGVVGAQNIYFSWKLGWTMGVSLTSSILGYAMMQSMKKSTICGSLSCVQSMFKTPFGVKENCMMQTAASSAASMSSASGLAVGLFALTSKFQRYAACNGLEDGVECTWVADPLKTYDMNWREQLSWCYGILMLGFFVAVPLRKTLIEDYNLVFPSGTATAYVMKAVHTSKAGAAEGQRQFKLLTKCFLPSAVWFFFKRCCIGAAYSAVVLRGAAYSAVVLRVALRIQSAPLTELLTVDLRPMRRPASTSWGWTRSRCSAWHPSATTGSSTARRLSTPPA